MIKRIEEINKRKEMNFHVFTLVASYLNNCPDLVTRETIVEITNGVKANEERAFVSFLANVFSENEDEIKLIEKEYLSRGIKQLSPEEYLKNPFLVNIKIPEIKEGNWNLGYQTYKPYEGFIYRDIETLPNYTEIPQIGYFNTEFSYPTVFENGIEWMAIKPNEIETMKAPIEKARGRVLVYGLGIGYFAYMVSLKQEVESVTIVERDQNVINLFKQHILPQFPNKSKINIVKSDAFDYAKSEMKAGNFNYVFTDLWHDVSDGVDLYVKMKKYEGTCPNSQFEYWIEKSLLSSIRWSIFGGIYTRVKAKSFNGTIEEIEKYLTDDYLKSFVKFI
ncbi:MAG: hypothetical protein E7596_01550 [Ruminococcaceae bacterium]|nr:hypothetical protein [Oscillospiraceae bacterium]